MEEVILTEAEIESGRKRFVQISPNEAESLILSIGNTRFILVEFIKRTTGGPRRMVCRVGVKKHLKGGPPAYNPKDYDLVWVWEPGPRGGYRSIPKDNIVRIVVGDTEYSVEKEDKP